MIRGGDEQMAAEHVDEYQVNTVNSVPVHIGVKGVHMLAPGLVVHDLSCGLGAGCLASCGAGRVVMSSSLESGDSGH